MTYEYVCRGAHRTTVDVEMGRAPLETICAHCERTAYRDYSSVQLPPGGTSDQFRRAYLSEKTRVNLERQQRAMDPMAPTCNEDAKVIAAATGRVYVGDSIEGFTPKARAAIERGKGKPQ